MCVLLCGSLWVAIRTSYWERSVVPEFPLASFVRLVFNLRMRLPCRFVVTLCAIAILWCGLSKAQSVDGSTNSVEQKVRAIEKACVSNLRTLNVAQIAYWGGDDAKGFAPTLRRLGPDGASLLDAATVNGQKDGYRFRLVPDRSAGDATPIKHYKIIARPVTRLSKNQRSYYTDESGVIRFTEERREPTKQIHLWNRQAKSSWRRIAITLTTGCRAEPGSRSRLTPGAVSLSVPMWSAHPS